MKKDSLGVRIKYHRKRLGMTQEQLAERMGVTPQAVSKWENDLSCPDIAILPQLAELFGISVDELLGNEGASKKETVHEAIPVEAPQKPKNEFVLRVDKFSFPVWLLTLGGLLLARQLLHWEIDGWRIIWTSTLIVFGLFGMIKRFSAFQLAVTLGGTVFLLDGLKVLPLAQSGWSIVLPVFLLILGLCLFIDLFVGKKWIRHCKPSIHAQQEGNTERFEFHLEDGELDCDICFSSRTVRVNEQLFRGGDLDCAFSNVVLDLSGVQSISDDCRLDVDCSFGELRLRVPSRFRVQCAADTAFSKGVRIHGSPNDNTAGMIYLDCDISFGSIEIEYI